MAHPKVADLEGLLEALTAAGVEFVIVGGVAAVLHGAPVTTLDLDIVHRRTEDNVARLLGVLNELSAEIRPARDGVSVPPARNMLLGDGQVNLSTTLGPLDVLCQLHSGEDYEALLPTAVTKGDDTLGVQAIDLETLIRIKMSTGRAKDKMTVPVLIALREKTSS